MALEKFNLKTLACMDDGRARVAFDQALKRLQADLEDRPATFDARTVSLTVSMVPVLGEDGELDSVDITYAITDKIPKRKSKVYNSPIRKGEIFTNELSPEDGRQLDMFDQQGPEILRGGKPGDKEAEGDLRDTLNGETSETA